MNPFFNHFYIFSFGIVLSFASISSNDNIEEKKANLCFSNNYLFPPISLKNYSENSEVLADSSEISNNLYKLIGNVSVTSKDYHITGEQIFIDSDEKYVESTSNVKFQDNSMFLVSDYAKVTKLDDQKSIQANNAEFILNESYTRGYASSLDGTESFKTFNNATYTKCPVSSNAWSINSKKITLDTSKNIGKSTDTSLWFFGIPIFYSPYFDWVLEGRGTGFLAPSISSYNENNSTEYKIRIPYYLNIAPNRDLLLALNTLTSRGEAIEANYRSLINNDLRENTEIGLIYLDDDKLDNKSRWSFDSKLNYKLFNGTWLNVNKKRVSDKNFFKDIAHKNTSSKYLLSNARVSHYGKIYAKLYSEHEQLINNGLPSYIKDYEIELQKNIPLKKSSNLKLGLITTDFTHKDFSKTNGQRSHIDITFDNKLIDQLGYSIFPSISLFHTFYDLSNGMSPSRSSYIFNLDSTLNLEREFRLFNLGLIQTLTPKVIYKYSPRKQQSAIPIFDTEGRSGIGSFSVLSNPFYGLDRISNANDIIFSLSSEVFNEDNGQTYLDFDLSQRHYLDDKKLNIDGDFDNIRDYSNINLNSNLSINKFDLSNNVEFDPEISSIVRSSTTLSYLINSRNFLSLSYFDDLDESIALNGSLPLNSNYHIFGGINRSILNSRNNKVVAGLAYDSCCWAMRLAHFKNINDNNSFDKVTSFEIVFKGLSSSTPSLKRRIRSEIPFYDSELDNLSSNNHE